MRSHAKLTVRHGLLDMAQLFGTFYWSRADYDAIMVKLDRILDNQTRPSKQQEKMMSALDDLKAQVEKNTSLEQSGIQLIQGIARQLQEANMAGDNAAITQLTQQLESSAAALSAAISANTQVTPVT